MEELAELAAEMYDLYPFDDMARDYPFMGEESLTLDQAMELMGDLHDMDDLERQLQQVMRSGNLEDLEPGQGGEPDRRGGAAATGADAGRAAAASGGGAT